MFEKVNPSHPDKVADRIAGAMVDLAYSRERDPRVAVEVLIGHGMAYVIAESSVAFTVDDVQPIVDRIAGEGLAVRLLSIPQDSHLADNQQGAIRCGDNGIFRGCAPTREQKLLTAIAASIYDRHPSDGKYIIDNTHFTVDGTRDDGKHGWVSCDLTICQSYATEDEIRKHLDILKPKYFKECPDVDFNFHFPKLHINPLGPWTGGPNTDSGATNRKLGSDMGDGVTGGGLHGKDLSKADVSVNIWCYLESIRTGHQVTASCSIGDETVNGIPYKDIVEQARLYIHTLGGFEKFAEWGLLRP